MFIVKFFFAIAFFIVAFAVFLFVVFAAINPKAASKLLRYFLDRPNRPREHQKRIGDE